jgi:DNA-binding NtrC family response regulator
MLDPSQWKILLVDDDAAGRAAMSEWLERRGFQPIAVGSGREAVDHMQDGIAVIVSDLKMPGMDGLELLQIAKKRVPHAAVILVSGHGTVDVAVSALKQGAFDFLTKPVNLEELTHRINRAMEKRAMAAEIAQLHAQLNERSGLQDMIGNSPGMRQLFEKIRMVADTKSTVLITGESGTGKELVARSLHQLSSRVRQPFIPVNCAAIPETLIESELFGHEKGAFTGASDRSKGLFQAADGGSLFIDEIGELQLGLQSKLLRAIENKKIMPVGSSAEVDVDVRLIAATNRDMMQQVEKKEFREDLYYRLKVIELHIPPLRERPEDIPLLVRHFVDEIATENNRPVKEVAPDALAAIESYRWPGNVRELHNTLEGIIILSLNDRIELDDLPGLVRGAEAKPTIVKPGMTMREIEKEAIRQALEETDGHRANAAELLDISVRTLQRKIKEYGLA